VGEGDPAALREAAWPDRRGDHSGREAQALSPENRGLQQHQVGPARSRMQMSGGKGGTKVPAPKLCGRRPAWAIRASGEFVPAVKCHRLLRAKCRSSTTFTFDAASLKLTSHEARPGQELQFDSMVEAGALAIARGRGLRSTAPTSKGLGASNAEKKLMPAYMPGGGQLILFAAPVNARRARAVSIPTSPMGQGQLRAGKALRVLKGKGPQSLSDCNGEPGNGKRYMFHARPPKACFVFLCYNQTIGVARLKVEKRPQGGKIRISKTATTPSSCRKDYFLQDCYGDRVLAGIRAVKKERRKRAPPPKRPQNTQVNYKEGEQRSAV